MARLEHPFIEKAERMCTVAPAHVDALVVDIGGIPIRLCGEGPFLGMAQNRYIAFSKRGSQPRINLSVDVVPHTDSSQEDLRVACEAGVWSVERGDFRLQWDPKSNSGRLQLQLNAYSLDTALRILHTVLLAEQRGFLLHAASAVRGERAFIFFGASGSGKTTISRMAPGDTTLLTDEISYVRCDSGKYLAYGTPFTGELAKPGENVSATIGALYHLVKAPANRLVPMSATDAARTLLGSVLFFAQDPRLVTLIFQSVCDLVCQLPVYRLEFVPNRSIWDLVQ